MDKYKINYIFNKKDINDILIDVLNKELKTYYKQYSLKESKKCIM